MFVTFPTVSDKPSQIKQSVTVIQTILLASERTSRRTQSVSVMENNGG